MAALGRLIGTLGWLWFIAGFVAPIFDVSGVSIFPGLILVFVGRVLRGQARRQGTEQESASTVEQGPAARPLNSERPQPAPVVIEPPPKPVEPPLTDTVIEAPQIVGEEQTSERLFTRVVAAADVADVAHDDAGVSDELESSKPLTSAEMVARARQRWDRRP